MSLRRFDGLNFNFWKEQMQDYLIVKGQIDPIENEVAPKIYKANEWQKLDRIVRATIQMHLSESVYFTVQSWSTAFELWKTLSNTYEKKVPATKIYLIWRLYNLRMKDSDSVQAYLNEYESLSSQISSQGTTIEDELREMILMGSRPSSWETFITTVCNASTTAIKYSEVTSAILTKATRRKSFTKDSAEEAYRSTRFDRPIKQPGKKFFPIAEQSAKPEQVPGQPNLQLLQETGTHQSRLSGTQS